MDEDRILNKNLTLIFCYVLAVPVAFSWTIVTLTGKNLLPLFLMALFIPYLFYLRRVQGALYPQEEQEEAGRKAISKRGKEGLVFIGLVSLSMLIVFLSLINMDFAFFGIDFSESTKLYRGRYQSLSLFSTLFREKLND